MHESSDTNLTALLGGLDKFLSYSKKKKQKRTQALSHDILCCYSVVCRKLQGNPNTKIEGNPFVELTSLQLL